MNLIQEILLLLPLPLAAIRATGSGYAGEEEKGKEGKRKTAGKVRPFPSYLPQISSHTAKGEGPQITPPPTDTDCRYLYVGEHVRVWKKQKSCSKT